MSDIIDICIPKHTVILSDRDKEWITPLTKYLIQERWNAYRKGQWEKYRHLKEKAKVEIARAKSIWADKMRKSTNGLWKLVNNMRGKVNSDPISDLLAAEDNSVESLINKMVTRQSVTLTADGSISYCPTLVVDPKEKDDDWAIEIREQDVRNLLRRASPSKAPGSDCIPNKVYRSLADIIAHPLTVIFRNSVSKRMIPLGWKKGLIIPLPKTKPPSLDKMRYITLLPLPLKILERLVLRSVWKHFEAAYGPEQHGFRPRASTTTALIALTNAASFCLNDPLSFGLAIVSFDLSRAFDTIDCSLALRKMKKAGFPNGFLAWLQNYFSNRTGAIKVRGQFSEEFSLSRGVPQGSVLGPPIFCAYVSDLKSSTVGVTTIKYADDINLVVPLHNRNSNDIRCLLDAETNHIRALCSSNHLTLNVDKSKFLLVSRRIITFDVPPQLPCVKTLKILGFVINDKLKWTSHIDQISKKCAQRMHVLRKLRGHIPVADLHLVYCSLIRSLLEYASPVFVGLNTTMRGKLDKIDKRAHRIIAGFSCINQSFCDCESNTLNKRRLDISEKLFNSIESSPCHLLHQFIPPKLPRSKMYSVPFASNDKYFNSFFPFMARFLNSK
jgi:hypothetical protein